MSKDHDLHQTGNRSEVHLRGMRTMMRELPRDLVTILRTEARNQRTPPIDYAIAEDGGRMVVHPDPDIAMAELLEEAATALESAISAVDAEPVASIVPPYCSGTAFIFEPGVLHVNKDGGGYIAINEDDFVLDDDRCEGEDGPEGSIHWIARMDASEISALRDFLNGTPAAPPSVAVKADDLCRSPIIEAITPTTEEWEACETIQDRYNLMKRRIRSALVSPADTSPEPQTWGEKQAEIERLTAERDRFRDEAKAERLVQKALREKTEAENERLRKALAPFAELPDNAHGKNRYFLELLVCPEGDEPKPGVKNYGVAIRNARAALASHASQSSGPSEYERGLEDAAKVADVECQAMIDKRDECLSEGPPNCHAALVRARQAQTAEAIAATIRALKEKTP